LIYLFSTGANCILLSVATILAFRYVLKASQLLSSDHLRRHEH
jgi:hypothetical protein